MLAIRRGEAPEESYFIFTYSPIRDESGGVGGVFCAVVETTARVLEERRLRLLGILAHDLRSPLGAVLTAAQLLVMRSSDDQIVKPANRTLASAKRMGRMIEQLLDFTSIRLGGGLSLQRNTCDLADLMKRVLAEVEAAAPGWKIDLEAAGDAVGEWDGDRLAQVVSNLAGNAVQHGAREAPLRVRLDGASPSAIVVSFENRGHDRPRAHSHALRAVPGRAAAPGNFPGRGPRLIHHQGDHRRARRRDHRHLGAQDWHPLPDRLAEAP